MSRKARKKSSLGIHYVIVRGPRGSRVLGDFTEKVKYLESIERYHAEGSVKLFAYCILDNEVHLLLEEEEENVSQFMKRVGISYVRWYNRENKRSGALFRDRYASSPIEDPASCIQMIRRIHQLPVLSGYVPHMEDYPFTSYRAYLYEHRGVDRDELVDRLGDWDYRRFMNGERGRLVAEAPVLYGRSDNEVGLIIRGRMGGDDPDRLRTLPGPLRNRLLEQLRFEDNISISQLARVTGIGRGVIQRIKPDKDGDKHV